ncbi:hypothetical protein F8M41_004113 [Gigaspora margarita]|uniref:Uncharacterized protein n=1 Tax=Gigaspora margarita TaxID=4874 RepID=A0A8H4AXS0_GIGMA|nr:hypothetical protein F8M41_004113 [Gigaspora margarita]
MCVKVRFLSSGSVLSLNTSEYMDPNSNISVYGPKTASEYFVTPLTHGGYVFTTYTLTPDSNITFSFNMFDDSDKLVSLESKPINFPGVFAILSNNTLLLAQPETTNSWSLLVEELPRIAINQDHGYGNLQVNSSIPKINSVIPLAINSISITYYDQVDLSNGNITIYQIIDSKHAIIRQLVTGDNNQYCSLSSDGNSVENTYSDYTVLMRTAFESEISNTGCNAGHVNHNSGRH